MRLDILNPFKEKKYKDAFISVLRHAEKKSYSSYPSFPITSGIEEQVKYLKREIDYYYESNKSYRTAGHYERDGLRSLYQDMATRHLNSLTKLRYFYTRLKDRCSKLRAENQRLKARLAKYEEKCKCVKSTLKNPKM